jgi:carbon storage regulator
MLVLGRKEGESFFIGKDIVVTILRTQPGGNTRIGIDAPKEITILRRELIKKIDKRPFKSFKSYESNS